MTADRKHQVMGRFPVTLLLCTAVALAPLLSACNPRLISGPFHKPELIETAMTRGVSTKGDARRLFGEPNGAGFALLPGQQSTRDVWCYEDVELAEGAQKTGGAGSRIDLRQQVLLLTFDKEIFDGYMWYINTVSGQESR